MELWFHYMRYSLAGDAGNFSMTWQQSAAFGLIALMMAAFVWGRFRYDLVAMVTLLVAVLIGVVPADKAFSGFSGSK